MQVFACNTVIVAQIKNKLVCAGIFGCYCLYVVMHEKNTL